MKEHLINQIAATQTGRFEQQFLPLVAFLICSLRSSLRRSLL
jgi:hypothetical protein